MHKFNGKAQKMIKISKMADYATRIMQVLAKTHERLSAAKLSMYSGIPEATVSKLLKKLAKSGLLESVQGVKGGYQLSERADIVTLAQIVIAIDGPLALTSCVITDANCAYSACCDQQGNWQTISELIFGLLDRISLQDMLGQLPKEKVDMLRFVPISELKRTHSVKR